MEEKNKKKWLQPQLTVLVRRKPEEGILATCKVGPTGGGPNELDWGCIEWVGWCSECDKYGTS